MDLRLSATSSDLPLQTLATTRDLSSTRGLSHSTLPRLRLFLRPKCKQKHRRSKWYHQGRQRLNTPLTSKMELMQHSMNCKLSSMRNTTSIQYRTNHPLSCFIVSCYTPHLFRLVKTSRGKSSQNFSINFTLLSNSPIDQDFPVQSLPLNNKQPTTQLQHSAINSTQLNAANRFLHHRSTT